MTKKSLLFLLVIAVMAFSVVSCKKEGTDANKIEVSENETIIPFEAGFCRIENPVIGLVPRAEFEILAIKNKRKKLRILRPLSKDSYFAANTNIQFLDKDKKLKGIPIELTCDNHEWNPYLNTIDLAYSSQGIKLVIRVYLLEKGGYTIKEIGLRTLDEIPEEIAKEDLSENGVEGGTEGGVEGGVLGGKVNGVLVGVVGEVEAPIRLIGDIEPPKLIKQIEPIYPEIARQAKVEGTVSLEVTTDIYGRVQGVKILRSIPLLDQSAIDAVSQWVFEPMIINGKPRGVIFTVPVRFRLE